MASSNAFVTDERNSIYERVLKKKLKSFLKLAPSRLSDAVHLCGGAAIILHGHERATEDLDFVLKGDEFDYTKK